MKGFSEPGPPVTAPDRHELSLISLSLSAGVLKNYGDQLGFQDFNTSLAALGAAISVSPGWEQVPEALIVTRPLPAPGMAFLGCFDTSRKGWVEAQSRRIAPACEALHFFDYPEAERKVRLLAAALRDSIGDERLSSARFAALPRGGLVVLGLLAPFLGLKVEQLSAPEGAEVPLCVVVDDCALTGKQFGRFLSRCKAREVIFAPLCSHSALRTEIIRREPRVTACLSAHDLEETGGAGTDEAWRRTWKERVGGGRYWTGRTEFPCFPWNEPDALIWNKVIAECEPAWKIVPSDKCLKNNPPPGRDPVPLQVQSPGKGPLRPADHVFYADLGDRVLLGETVGGNSYLLEGEGAAMWKAMIRHGRTAPIVQALIKEYDVAEKQITRDVANFLVDLRNKNLLSGSE